MTHPTDATAPAERPQPLARTSHTLAISCPDRAGRVASITSAIFQCGGNIRAMNHFADPDTGMFFMRVVFDSDVPRKELDASLAALKSEPGMRWHMRTSDEKQRVLLMVSKFDHCLSDLLYRTRVGELNMEVVGIVSNHPRDMLRVRELDGIPFHHLPITKDTKPQQEAQIRDIVTESGADLVVLARYMQILSNDMSAWLAGRCINIHHSFLPSFKGAKPYHQAHAHGVKMIGATAHYVTQDLDEGPIIHQIVEPVSHEESADDLVRKGRNIEQRVLSQAVLCHLQQRVFLNGRKTIVFAA